MLEARCLLASDIVINEFLAANTGIVRDFAGDSSDWIELRNVSDRPVDMSGWYLSDDANDLSRWEFPSVTIESRSYLVVFASGKDVQAGTELHTNFRLRAAGEFLALTEPDGQTVATSYSPAYPAQLTNVSFGLPHDNELAATTFLLTPTPGRANATARLFQTVSASSIAPTFVDPFALTLSGTSAGQRIVYTLDGTIPTTESPTYDAPLPVNQGVQVRARIVEQEALGPVRSWGYSQLSQEVAEFSSDLPILLIDNFGAGPIPNKGFPNQTGADTFQLPRQAATVTLFEPTKDGQSNLTSEVDLHERIGIRVRGAFSSTFSEPGYSLEFWDESNKDRDVALLDLHPHSDWVLYAPNPETDKTLIDNTFLFSVSNEMGHWAPSFRYVEAFINTGNQVSMSDYVGLYVIEDKVSRGDGRIEFARMSSDATQGGWLLTVNRMDAVPEDNPNAEPQNFHTAGPNGILETGPNASGRGDDIPRQYNAFLNFEDPNGYEIDSVQRTSIEQWFADMEDVLYSRTEVEWNDPINGYARYIDVASFIDYFILNNISNNGDGFLLSMWLYNPDPQGEGKLTMGPIWDADLGSFQGNAASRIRSSVDRLWYGRMFEDLEFQQAYIDRWFELRASTLSSGNIHEIIDGLQQTITNEAAIRDGVPDWQNRIRVMKSWLDRRLPLIDELYTQPPTVIVSQNGLRVSGAGKIYYTMNGTDPRQTGGAPSAAAVLVSDEIVSVPASFSGTVTIRSNVNGNWSAPKTAAISGGHVNADGQLNSNDIDAIWAAVRETSRDPIFDLNFDEQVDEADVQYLVESVFKTRFGDTNLDGRVDFADFQVLSASFGKEATWNGGNFDADRLTSFADFLLLSANFGFGNSN